MPQDVELNVDDVLYEKVVGQQVQFLTLTLRYTGTIDLSGKVVQGELLSIEIPSHAPPPQP